VKVAARSEDAILTRQGMLENFHSLKHDFQIFIGFNWIFLLCCILNAKLWKL